jgi:histidinol-phosphate aminotransferase
MSVDVPPPVRAELVGVEPYGAPQLDVPVRLNTNETAEAPPSAFLAALARAVTALELNRYPDREALALRTALAAREDLAPDRVWVANGSNEVLLQVLQAYGGPGRTALIFRPGYSMYPELCRTTGTAVVEQPLGPDGRLDVAGAAAAAGSDATVVLLANPNNPTGALVGPDVVRRLHDAVAGLVVVDEAYIEFAPPGASVRPLLDELPRLVVSRTFSKAFRLAGLRLGYLLGPAEVMADLRRVRLPYHLDAVTQVAGLLALEHEAEFLGHRAGIVHERERVAATLAALPGVEVIPSAANFLLFRTPVLDLFDRLLARGVLVRDVAGSAGPGALRVTIGTAAEDDAFLGALTEALAEVGAGAGADADA